MRLAALLPRSARSRVSPARDAEHIEAWMHMGWLGSRDESPEVGAGVGGGKAKVSGNRKILCVT